MRRVPLCTDHYIRIFNSWVDSYEFPAADADGNTGNPSLTGRPFNDAYRYMDWLLTVPLLLIEIIFCCNLPADEVVSQARKLGASSGLMIILGYPGELIIEGDLSVRFVFWFLAMIPFLYVVCASVPFELCPACINPRVSALNQPVGRRHPAGRPP